MDAGSDAASDSGGDSGNDAGSDAALDSDGDGGALNESCRSLFAARILEQQIELDGSFPQSCDEPLRNGISRLNSRGDELCHAGESANGCRQRVYDTPPGIGDLDLGCRNVAEHRPGCLRGRWLPRCENGSDDCAEAEAVCQDGTRPMAYMEAAQAESSNSWVFYMGGEGRPCSGQECWFNYRHAVEVAENLGWERATSTLHPDHLTSGAMNGTGIVAGDPTEEATNPFVGYNRVRFKRCSDSNSNGVETVPLFDQDLETTGTGPVWHKGLSIWRSLFRSLTTEEGRDLDGDHVADLPSLTDADTVLLAASSDATVWLTHAADELRHELRDIAGSSVDVRIVVDGYFDPMLDGEARFSSDAPPDFNMFDHTYSVTGICELPDNDDGEDNEGCSDAAYSELTFVTGESTIRGELVARSALLDASCLGFHGEGAPQCFDKLHVLFHHVSTPFFVIADQEDPTTSRLPTEFADNASYRFAGPDAWRLRVLHQFYDVQDFWATASRGDGPGTPGMAVMVLRKQRRNDQPPAWARHTHVGSDDGVSLMMSQCDQDGEMIVSASLARTLHTWFTDELPFHFIAEDGVTWSGEGSYFVTGAACREPD